MPITTDVNDPRINEVKPNGQNEAYLVLSDEERAKGFVRPVRRSYKHVGLSPKYPLRDLNEKEKQLWGDEYVKFETYPEGSNAVGKFWTKEDIDKIGKGCGVVTTMAQPIAETWARSIHFYSHTYCSGCQTHLPVAEFVWDRTDEVMGT